MKPGLAAYCSAEVCKLNLNSSAELSLILVSFTLRFDILVARHQGNVLSEACPISWRSRLQTGGQCASWPSGHGVDAWIVPTPSSVITLSALFKSLAQRPWHRSGEWTVPVLWQESIKQVITDLDDNEGVHGEKFYVSDRLLILQATQKSWKKTKTKQTCPLYSLFQSLTCENKDYW